MLTKLSVDQVLTKAKSHAKKGDLAEAEKLYETILQNLSNNIRGQQGLGSLNKPIQRNVIQNPPQEEFSQLVKLYNQGQIEAVIQLAEALTAQYPGAYVVWNILGASKAQIGMLDEAVEAYKKSISLKPDFAEAYSNMGVAFQAQSKFDVSIKAYNKAVSLKPDYAEAYNNMGVSLKAQGRLDEAIDAYKKCVSLKPDHAEAYDNMGVAFKKQGMFDEALEAHKKCISLKPFRAEAYNNLGNTLKEQGRFDLALENYNKAISLKPNYADAYFNIGVALKDQGKFDEAIDAYKKCILLKPNDPKVYNDMGDVLYSQGKLDEAIETFKKSISLKPDYAEAHYNMGLALQYHDKSHEAIKTYTKAISLKPDYAEAHQNLGLTLLNIGRLKEGLDEFEWRWKTSQFMSNERRFIQPMWDGSQSLKNKRILLWCEQGIGDTINWSCFLPLVYSITKNFTFECHDKLVPLLQRSFPNVEVKSEDRSLDMNRDDFDYHLPMGSLYRHFLSEITENTRPKAYLVPDPDRVNYWRERLTSLGKGPYIGIAWKSSNMSSGRLPNYAPILEWSPVLKIPDVTFINLQYKDFEDDLAKVKDELGVTVHNFDDLDQYNNVDDVTALCAALDMVITTKITVVYMSAGVGTTTKLANWKQSYWNNVVSNPQSSSVDIFEKNTWEPWDNVFRLIGKDIFKQINN